MSVVVGLGQVVMILANVEPDVGSMLMLVEGLMMVIDPALEEEM